MFSMLLLAPMLITLVSAEFAACEPITSQLPPECPGTVGPPCPRCYNNTRPDYTPGASLRISDQLKADLTKWLDAYLGVIADRVPPTYYDSPTVFSGTAGRALLYFKLWKLSGNSAYLETANQYMSSSLDHLSKQKSTDLLLGYSGFLWSHVGMISLGAVIAEATSLQTPDITPDLQSTYQQRAQDYCADVQAVITAQTGKYDDFDSGRAGLLFAGHFLNTNLAKPCIDQSSMLRLAKAIVDRGASLMTPSQDYMQWHGPNDSGLWLDTSHGASGILYALLEFAPEIIQNATASSLIQKTIDHIVSTQLPSGNFPTEYWGETDDVLVQWDHGAPGMSAMLWRAGQAFNNQRYTDSAAKAMDCVWDRGILSKGLMQCHGITGNTYMMIDMYQGTKEDKYLYRAIQIQEFVMQYPLLHDPAVMRKTDPTKLDFQYWVGSYTSAAVIWAEFLYAGPASAHMTGFSSQL